MVIVTMKINSDGGSEEGWGCNSCGGGESRGCYDCDGDNKIVVFVVGKVRVVVVEVMW